MSRLQAIEQELIAINETVFQELCDSILILRNRNYSIFSRTGSQSGKQKTIKGTPDTFLLLPNGKYIFVEYSTNINLGLNKIVTDIEKCIDTYKTGVSIEEIAEIIYCVNFNIDTQDVNKLKALIPSKNIELTIYTLDALALELHLNHRDLSHQYLGLSLDTGQIVNIETFIAEYNQTVNGISTPLDNTFLHREEELKDLNNSIERHDFVIITGSAGVGKTKLALEGITNYLRNNTNCNSYCISYKNHDLLDDLYLYFDNDKDFILFVDDANRIDSFNQILGFYRKNRKGRFKIIVTVRDYALTGIEKLCSEFVNEKIILQKLSDAQINDIIKAEPFLILNEDYQREIIRIADGNPRIAIMTALLAKAKQNIYALADVSDLFENYFNTFVKDEGEFRNKINIQCLGIISFFYTIPYKDKEITSTILSNFGIEYVTFIDVIEKLERLELVDIKYDYVKIPEQNLSSFFFYKAFIKDNLLSFRVILEKYFDSNIERFKECVISANNTFGPEKVMDKLRPILKEYWVTVKIKQPFDISRKFVHAFWYYLQKETLAFLYEYIYNLPPTKDQNYQTEYKNNEFTYNKNEIIDLLSLFFHTTISLEDALNLSFEYIKKEPHNLPELIFKIRENLAFDVDDEYNNYSRQVVLFQVLIENFKSNDILFIKIFYVLAQTFLGFKFHHTKPGRHMSITLYDFQIPNNKEIHSFRSSIWEVLESNSQTHKVYTRRLIKEYLKSTHDFNKDIIKTDLKYLLNIIVTLFNETDFDDCKIVQDLIKNLIKNNVTNETLEELQIRFTNPIYKFFLEIDWNRRRDKEIYDFDNYEEYEKLKELDIRSYFILNSKDDVMTFYETYKFLLSKAENDWNYRKSLDIILDENFKLNMNSSIELLKEIIHDNNSIKFYPFLIFKNNLKNESNVNKIWETIDSKPFQYQDSWKLAYLENIHPKYINDKTSLKLKSLFVNCKENLVVIYFNLLKQYLPFYPNLFQEMLLFSLNHYEKNKLELALWYDFFTDYYDLLGTDIELIKKAYLLQRKIQHHFDIENRGFLKIIKNDTSFLLEFINKQYSDENKRFKSQHEYFGFIWEVDNIEITLTIAFDSIIPNEMYFGILEHYCNIFFKRIPKEFIEKAKRFLFNYFKNNLNDVEKVNAINDIFLHSMKQYHEEFVLFYLSLSSDLETFSKIQWVTSGGSYSGDVTFGELKASEWKKLQVIVEKSDIGLALIPIKKYIADNVEAYLKSAEHERKRRYIEYHDY